MLVLRASRSWARVGQARVRQHLACDQADNRYIHRVANITIQARDHQMARGKWRSGRTQSLQREARSEEHTSELQSPCNLVCRLLLEKKKKKKPKRIPNDTK